MANFTRNFIAGRMNKTFDERIVPDGEYINAMNIRMGSTERSEAGVIENTKGNLPLTTLTYVDGTPLTSEARCIGAIDDSANETLYWFVHDPNFQKSPTGKLDLIVSYNTTSLILTYHVVSVNDGGGINTTLNFNPQYLITGVNLIENLLFFTDDYNQPRFINVTRNYDNPDVTFVDNNGSPDILREAILVIKKPPTEAPTIELIELAGQENYLEERFICFAYRYKYADGEYSATSQWSEPAFYPNTFAFSPNTFLNEGMTNQYNAVDITFNTGGPLVVGVDLLFKAANGNIIKVIEKFDKDNSPWVGTSTTAPPYQFTNSKIFTILSEAELLRLYDNVPRLSKAQTIMGNRLMYGNYVDGYNLIDANGTPVQFTYQTELISTEIGTDIIPFTVSAGSIPFSNTPFNPCSPPCLRSNTLLNIDLYGVSLNQGYLLSIDITFDTSSILGYDVTCGFNFTLTSNYLSVYQLATSVEFQNAIGTIANIKPIYNPIPGGDDSCDGLTFTDIYNCAFPQFLSLFLYYGIKYESGITANGEPISISASPSSNIISLQFPCIRYYDATMPIGSDIVALFPAISTCGIKIEKFTSQKSLHSNRDYEIGIVYMDEFNRATPANVSSFNTVHIPCSFSPFANSITVNIPPTQIAPSWAKKYKFVCKADMAGYETIYSNIFFTNPSTQETYFLLQGESARKVEEGDRFIVKADSEGPMQSCVYATVLEKEAKQSGFDPLITPAPPAGVYMKIKANGFSVNQNSFSIINYGSITSTSKTAGTSPILAYLVNVENPAIPGTYIPYSIDAGSVIVFDIKFQRLGQGAGCEKRIYTLKKTYVSSSNYTSFKNWFIGDNIANTLNDGIQDIGGGQCLANNVFIPTNGTITSGQLCDNFWRFYTNPITFAEELYISGTWACGSTSKRKSSVTANITVFRIADTIVFETMPQDTLPDVFFENNLSFPIDAKGNHLSNGSPGDVSQHIASGTYGVIQTGFFNCFAFGNGVESYKIRDSIVGRDFNLGNRVTTVAAQDYSEERRFADITYSGIYNPETNVNKLNEFNSGLLNYKNLELSFGAIYILDGRETDVLVLQEDKVSYVLAGKNLLSDAAAGGAITSVPEVLGTQIARVEKYGISFNPESYVQWGYDRFFTDAKRGAVLQLKGNAYSNEQLTVISEQNMRTWFRDTFNGMFNTQKIGGFDPYMNEYVLTLNDIDLPSEQECLKCNVTQTLTFAQGEGNVANYDYCVDLGSPVGTVVIDWNISSIDPMSSFVVEAVYDGNTYTSTPQTTAGALSFLKYAPTPNNVDVSLTVTGNAVIIMNVRCPEQESATLIEVVLTNDSDAGESLMKQFNYVNGPYTSPLQSNFFIFSSGTGNPLVSFYLVTNGFAGQGNIPTEGSTMTLQTNETFPFVTFNFDPLIHKFKYARTTTLYGNNNVDMQALLAISNIATPIVSPITGIYNASFTVPPSVDGQYIYAIWDLRSSTEVQLCTSDNLEAVCCECDPCTELCSSYVFTNPSTETDDAIILLPLGTCFDPTAIVVTLPPGDSASYCLPNEKDNYVISEGNPVIYMESCFCGV
jgi:hypothetical protein